MQRAREAGLDLVEVDSHGQPPVCRILDYGKFKYEQAKRERDSRKHQRGTMIHEVRLRPRTGQHDIDLKVRIATRLLAAGDKVKLSVMFRGREISHPEVGREVLNKAIKGLGDTASIEKPPGMEGRFLTVILTPTAKGPAAKDETKARPANKTGGGSKRTIRAEKAAAARAKPARNDQKAPAKKAAAAAASAAPAGSDQKAPAKTEAAAAASAAPAGNDQKAPAKTEAAAAASAAPAGNDQKTPAKAENAVETKPAPAGDNAAPVAKQAEAAVKAKAAPAGDVAAPAAKQAEAAATAKKDEA